ncbi:MAG TPA: hypothetical protein VJ793_24490 [Anaerolineae bacterium]|nr:hypothetical protein [Anaerolineae bacterium]
MTEFRLLSRVHPRAASKCWRLLIAVAIVGLAISSSPISLLSAPAVPPGPVLVHPSDGTVATVANYPPAAVPYFEWQPVAGAATYRIQIDDDIGFGDPIRYNVPTPNTRYIPTVNSLLADGSWYWRVRVETPAPVGDWSEVRTFTKSWGDPANAPTLLAPDAGATIEFFEDPIFSWTPITGTAEYVLKIDNDFGCTSPSSTFTTLTTHYHLATRLVNGTYYWCVTPRDVYSRDGQTSESRQVTVQYAQAPQLVEPVNGSQPTYTPRFRWTAVKGATRYKLYYSTDPTFLTGVTSAVVDQTSYTPLNSLPNDVNYYWRVSAIYGPASVEGPFSEVWSFLKKWYHQPINLTPRNNELVNVTLFSWTPVREVKYYRIETSFDPGFAAIRWSADTPNTFYWRTQWDGTDWGKTVFWRVRPYDNNGNAGQASIVASFRPTYTVALPEAIYPRYFYPPPFIASGNYAVPRDIPVSYDYTVDTPTFFWSRTFVPGATPRVEADRYRIEVDDDPNIGSPDWTYETQNLSATPTDGTPFVPVASTNYYWRVTPLAQSGAVLTNSARNEPWLTQIDVSRLIAPTATTSPTLQRPADAEKVMDTLPSFQWLPQQGAVRYQFELSTDPAFVSTTYVTRTVYTHHTPPMRVPKGTYFWRVKGLNALDQTVGVPSSGRRLIVAYQTRWDLQRNYPTDLLVSTVTTTSGTLLASDAVEGIGAAELTSLYAAQDKDYWYVGFHVNPTLSGEIWYGLYLDGDQVDGSGASAPPPGRPAVTTSSYYRPEHAIYVVYSNTQFITSTVYLHEWDKIAAAWKAQVRNLVDPVQVGGSFHYSSTLNYVELKIPKTAIGDLGFSPFVLSAALFSATSDTAPSTSDTVPDNGNSTTALNEFKSIADRITLAVPGDSPPGGPPRLPYTPYVYAETPNVDYLRGYKLEVARDALFTSILETQDLDCWGCETYVDIFQYLYSTLRIYEDNTLYWRFSIKHRKGTDSFSPPSDPHAFVKNGPTPANLQTESEYSTPTFKWDAVEGAAAYRFELATNPDFSPLLHNATVNHENYTPVSAYAPGTYYWRVRAENSQGGAYQSGWSLTRTLNITLPVVTLSQPASGGVVNYAPTLKWQIVLAPAGQPTWGAAKYRVQVANSPTGFGAPFESLDVDTVNWTPAKSYPDGTYYWRVAVLDTGGRPGPFSSVYTLTKQYPVVSLVSPLTGTTTGAFPTFIWTPVYGAARYRIEIAKNPQFSPLYDSATTDNTLFIPTKRYDTAQYYWRVAIIDKSGNYGPWTDSILLVSPYSYSTFLPVVLKNP